MSHRLKISAPSVLRSAISSLEFFPKHEWLFDSNRDIIFSFGPDISVGFCSNREKKLTEVGCYLQLERCLVTSPDLIESADSLTHKDLSRLRYVTMTIDDEKSLSVRTPHSQNVRLKPVDLFKVNDVQGALMAVEMGLGYSALPKFLFNENDKRNSIQRLHTDCYVNQITLVVSTSKTNAGDLAIRSCIHAIALCLSATTLSPSVEFGYQSNVLTMPEVA